MDRNNRPIIVGQGPIALAASAGWKLFEFWALTGFCRDFDVMCPQVFLINQCQIITFLILKYDIIENSRIELRGIVLPVPSNQIKVTFISFWYMIFSCFT